MLRGQAFLAKQLPQVAIGDFGDAIRFGDYDLKAKAYVARANARSQLEQWSQAAADCTRAIRLQPKNGQAFLVNSRALAEMGRLDQAQTSLLAAEQLGIRTTWKIPTSRFSTDPAGAGPIGTGIESAAGGDRNSGNGATGGQ